MSRFPHRRLLLSLAGAGILVAFVMALLPGGPWHPAVTWLRLTAGLDTYAAGRAGPHGPEVTCPGAAAITVLIIGQSNAANYVDQPSGAPPGANVMLADEHCHPLADPIPGASKTGGSLWPAFAADLAARTGRPVAVIGAAIGATHVEQWVSRFGLPAAGLDRRIRAAQSVGHKVDLVIWIQGEADTGRGTKTIEYTERLQKVIARIDAETGGTPWIITLTSRVGTSRRSEAVRGGQQAVIAASPRIFAGPDTDLFDRIPEDRPDGVHFGRAAADRIAGALAEVAASALAAPAAAAGTSTP